MRTRVVLAGLALWGGVACSAQSGSVAGEWRGIWTNPEGQVFSAVITLETGPACKNCAPIGVSSISGKVVWTLRKAGPHDTTEYASRVGQSCMELVKGEMKGDGLLVLSGVKADDPNHLKGIDEYRLAVSDNGKVLGGITRNNGSWTGQLIAMRRVD